jgi:hypothetical protein
LRIRYPVVRDQEVAGSNPVTPSLLGKRPFGEYVEGLSLFAVGTYVRRRASTQSARSYECPRGADWT